MTASRPSMPVSPRHLLLTLFGVVHFWAALDGATASCIPSAGCRPTMGCNPLGTTFCAEDITLASTQRDFEVDHSQGYHGWWYGFDTGATFLPFTTFDPSERRWYHADSVTGASWRGGGGSTGFSVAIVTRFISGVRAAATLEVSFSPTATDGDTCSDGLDFSIWQDQLPLWKNPALQNSTDIVLNTTLLPGTTLEFRVATKVSTSECRNYLLAIDLRAPCENRACPKGTLRCSSTEDCSFSNTQAEDVVDGTEVEKMFKWEIDYDWVHPDGVWRQAYIFRDLVTRETLLPGPTLVIYECDTMIVQITNKLPTETVSIHWHGLHQRGSPWMDGTAHITQFPILPFQSFEYRIPRINQTGTHWYHSHSGTQYADGMYGMLIVRKKDDPITSRFNVTQELPILISEWYHRPSAVIDAELKGYVWAKEEHFPDYESALVNGQFRFNCSYAQPVPPSWFTQSKKVTECQPADYHNVFVQPDSVYRLRILNAASGLTERLSIDGHNLTVVAVDGHPVVPYEVQEIWIYVAQRYDVIVRTLPANSSLSLRNYWIRGRTLEDSPTQHEEVLAVLNYVGKFGALPNSTRENASVILTNDAVLKPAIPIPPPAATRRITITILCNRTIWICYVNGIAFQPPSPPALFSSLAGLDPGMGNVNSQYYALQYGEVVDLVVNAIGDQPHPIHLHGHDFWVMGMGRPLDGNYANQSLNMVDPVLRDTVQLQDHSWAVLRFKADNPGVWAFHCHLEWHLQAGMLLFFEEARDRIPTPPVGFPAYAPWSGSASADGGGVDLRLIDVALILVGAVLLVLLIGMTIGCLWLLKRQRREYHSILLEETSD